MASLHDLQWVVSHNSYEHPKPSGDDGRPFAPERFYDAGFRGYELDLWKNPDPRAWDWCVNHDKGYDKTSPKLTAFLDAIAGQWDGRDRDPVFLHLDMKTGVLPPGFPGKIDDLLIEKLGTRLFTPGDLLNGAGGWNEWPDPASPALRGRIIVVISGSSGPRKQYASLGPQKVAAFPDFNPYGKEKWLIVNTQFQTQYLGGLFGEWRSKRPSVLWRVYDSVPATKHRKAWSDTGANMLAMNCDAAYTSVMVGGSAFQPWP